MFQIAGRLPQHNGQAIQGPLLNLAHKRDPGPEDVPPGYSYWWVYRARSARLGERQHVPADQRGARGHLTYTEGYPRTVRPCRLQRKQHQSDQWIQQAWSKIIVQVLGWAAGNTKGHLTRALSRGEGSVWDFHGEDLDESDKNSELGSHLEGLESDCGREREHLL